GLPPAATAHPPAVTRLGSLAAANQALKKGDHQTAWTHILEATSSRPFHLEALLLGAEIARAAGHAKQARQYAASARELAPKWNAPNQFLKSLAANPPTVGESAFPLTPDVPTRPSSTRLSVCLIAKNEERFLSRCLESVRPIAHQIILVDTGSEDRTIEI